jgi:hypothetical protein
MTGNGKTMDLKQTTDYIATFGNAHIGDYLQTLKDIGPSQYPEIYDGHNKILSGLRDLVLGIQECCADMRVPQKYSSPTSLVSTLRGFVELASRNKEFIENLAQKNNGEFRGAMFDAHRISSDIHAAFTHALSLSTDAQKILAEPLSRLTRLLERLPAVARQLENRRQTHGQIRETLKVQDEYDFQDLLHAILKIEFDDVRPEEHTPSMAGGSSRMDFLLYREQIVVETKKTRESLRDKKIGEELIIDVAKYKKHPSCRHLVCAVWDTEHLLNNPAAVKGDLETANEGFVTVVILK